jgi:predicted nicotinamide N-methyase
VLTKADELIIAIAKLGEDVAQQLGVFSSVSTSNEPELETSTVLGIPIKLLKPSTTMLGMTRWEASTVLEDHLSQIVNKAYAKFSGLNILELGSGRGELAIALAKHGANVILSDYHHLMLRTLRNNVKANGLEAQTNVRVHHLDWGKNWEEGEIPFLAEGKTIDYVIGSDLIYSAEGGVLLGNLLVALASLPTTSNATFVFVYRHRDEDAERGVLSFFERVEPYFQIEIVQGGTRERKACLSLPRRQKSWHLLS